MPYTLTMGLIWFALAAMIGLVVGWVLRSAAASRQVARGRKQVQKELALEIDDLRERATTLGRAAEERDRLQAELESLKERQLALEGSPSGEVTTDSDDAVSENDGEPLKPVQRQRHRFPMLPSAHRCSVVASCKTTSKQLLALGLRLNGCVMVWEFAPGGISPARRMTP